MISHKKNFIFIRITKTASSSIINVLKEKAGIKGRGHTDALQARREYKENFENYFKFAFVRNPWDKAVSFYYYNQGRNWDRYPFKKAQEFNLFLKKWYTKGTRKGFHRLSHSPCLDWVTDKHGNVQTDFIGRFEDLQNDFNEVCSHIGIEKTTLPKSNKSNHKHYSHYYNQESIDIIGKMYEKDINYFNYCFDDKR